MCNCGRCGCLSNNTNNNVLSANTQNNNMCNCINNINQSNSECTLSKDWCNVLSDYIGRNCTCEFLYGDDLTRRTGVLGNIGQNFLILISPNNCNNRLVCSLCDLVSVRIN